MAKHATGIPAQDWARSRVWTRPWLITAALVWLAWLGLVAPVAATETVTLYVTNAQGTVVAEMTPQGQATYTATYRPYGKQPPGTSRPGPGYTGHVNDPDTGLVYMQARYYDPDVGRFLSPDPVGPTPGNLFNFNRYSYANDNPIRYTDPDGRCVDGLTCGTMLKAHVQWRMSHPNAPPDELEKTAFAGVGAMVGATLAPISPELGVAAKIVVRKVLSRTTQADDSIDVPKVAGKGRNKPPEPLKEAEGNPHSIIEKPGKSGQYTTYNGDGTWKQYRGTGPDHGGIPRPNIKEAGKNVTPEGREFIDKGRVRPPRPDEIPGV